MVFKCQADSFLKEVPLILSNDFPYYSHAILKHFPIIVRVESCDMRAEIIEAKEQ